MIKTEVELEEERRQAEELRADRERIARDRKIKMRELGKREEKHLKKSDEEIARQARDDAIRRMAEAKIDEESDVSKMLTSMASRAIAFTIRDQQLAEKRERENIEAEYDRRMDVIMELGECCNSD